MSDHLSSSPLVVAYDAVLPEIQAVAPKDYVSYPSNVTQTISSILNVHPQITPFKEALSRLPDFNMQSVDKLSTYGLATLHANANHPQPRSRRADAQALQRGFETRERYRAAAGTLIKHDLLDDPRLQTITMLRGFESVATDLATYGSVFRDGWAHVENNTPVHADDLDASDELAVQLLDIAAYRNNKKKQAASPSVVLRMGAYTLFANAWDEIERGLTYLLWRDSAKLESVGIRGPKKSGRKDNKFFAARAKARVANARLRKAVNQKAAQQKAANPPVESKAAE
jgi:hypothetical protein